MRCFQGDDGGALGGADVVGELDGCDCCEVLPLFFAGCVTTVAFRSGRYNGPLKPQPLQTSASRDCGNPDPGCRRRHHADARRCTTAIVSRDTQISLPCSSRISIPQTWLRLPM